MTDTLVEQLEASGRIKAGAWEMCQKAAARIKTQATRIAELEGALEMMPDEIEVFRLMRASGKTSRSAQARAVGDRIEEIRSKALDREIDNAVHQ